MFASQSGHFEGLGCLFKLQRAHWVACTHEPKAAYLLGVQPGAEAQQLSCLPSP